MAPSTNAPPAGPVAGSRSSLSRYLPAALFLVGASVALVAYLVLPWQTQTCPDIRQYVDPICANPDPVVPGSNYGPWSSRTLGLPLVNAIWLEIVYLGPALLCLLAAVPALVAHRSPEWRRAGIALGAIGGLYGVASAHIVLTLIDFEASLTRQTAVGFFVALAGFGAVLLGAYLLWKMYATISIWDLGAS